MGSDLLDKVCADLLEEFGIDMKAEIERCPVLDRDATARFLRDEAAAQWRANRKQFKESGKWPVPEQESKRALKTIYPVFGRNYRIKVLAAPFRKIPQERSERALDTLLTSRATSSLLSLPAP
jgi:hypothetical protein